MQNVSSEFQALMEAGTGQKKCRCTFGEIVIDSTELVSIDIEDAFNAGTEDLMIGCAVANKAVVKLFNTKVINYETEPIKIEVGVVLSDESIEYVNMGTYYPSKVTSTDEYQTVNIEAYDKIASLNVKYVPTVTLPTTDTAIVNDICTQYGIEFIGETLGCSIAQTYETTVAETLGYMAGLQGFNAHMTRDNKLDFYWYVVPSLWNEYSETTWADANAFKWYEFLRKERG